MWKIYDPERDINYEKGVIANKGLFHLSYTAIILLMGLVCMIGAIVFIAIEVYNILCGVNDLEMGIIRILAIMGVLLIAMMFLGYLMKKTA